MLYNILTSILLY